MVTKIYEVRLDVPIQRVWDFHNDPNALRVLTPDDIPIQWISQEHKIREGAIHEFKTKQMGLPMRWKAKIHQVEEPYGFRDTALKSPFKSWTHKHEFIDADGQTIVRDTITYTPPGGIFRKLINTLLIEDRLDHLFKYRHTAMHDMIETEPVKINEELIGASDHYASDFDPEIAGDVEVEETADKGFLT
ncbi:SRPBCC family protein [Kamptonema cortianum]|nr:SRPBCC family protein [Geitlerinema splendidum]MDK3160334.1 SRPBCC family protein [Kamptonema cortianum]